jgi:PEP-CTERM motif
MTRWFVVTVIGMCFLFSAVSQAGILYSLSTDYSGLHGLPPGSTVSWQFEVPSILTKPTTITSFLSTSLGFSGCGTIMDAQLPLPDFGGYTTLVITDFTGTCPNGDTGAGANFFEALTSPGVYDAYGRASGAKIGTLTISAVPEPTTMSLLSAGLLGIIGVRRRGLRG